jgi:hypothetical protein
VASVNNDVLHFQCRRGLLNFYKGHFDWLVFLLTNGVVGNLGEITHVTVEHEIERMRSCGVPVDGGLRQKTEDHVKNSRMISFKVFFG